MPEKGDEGAPPRKPAGAPRFRRPETDLVARAARRAIRGGRASFPSLTAFRAAVVEGLRRDEPLATVGVRRLRQTLVGMPGVRLSVRYTERGDGPLPARCPICGTALEPIRNRTLTGETIDLGRQCPKCAYWTHSARRVPVRYVISQGETTVRAARGRR